MRALANEMRDAMQMTSLYAVKTNEDACFYVYADLRKFSQQKQDGRTAVSSKQ